MTDTPHIDLTDAVEASARELYANMVSMRAAGRDPELYLRSLDEWDDKKLDAGPTTILRSVALEVIQACVSAIARQAFAVGVEAEADNETYAAVSNPWEDLDDELRNL